MRQRVFNVILLVGLAFSLAVVASGMWSWRLPDNQQGYSPEQPIAFSHRLHAGELKLDCRFCHSQADQGRYAGIPSSDTCMTCHKAITAPLSDIRLEQNLAKAEDREPQVVISPKLRKLYESLALGEDMMPLQGQTPLPLNWVRVHNLADYVYFDHRPHVAAGVTCQQCHGPVESMERMRQFSNLSMGWCVNCHRDVNAKGINGHAVNASTDCSACHY
jgi:hypothetical protein